MAWFLEERIREGGIPASASVINLQGAVTTFLAFSQAKRRDGSAVQSGDQTCVTVVQAGGLSCTCRGTLTLGGTNTVTLDASKIYQSTNGAALPSFDTNSPVDIFITTAVPLLAQFDDAGNLLDPDLFRVALIKIINTVGGFSAELGTVDGEAVVAPGVDAAGDELGGLFRYDISDSTPADDVDVVENINTAVGRLMRMSMKPWPTTRDQNVLAGNSLTIGDLAPAGGKPAFLRLVCAWSDDGAHWSAAIVLGHASAPYVRVLFEHGSLPFELSGTQLRVRNDTGGTLTVHTIKPVIG